MSIYCPISEALGILYTSAENSSYVPDEEGYTPFIPGAFRGQKHTEETKRIISNIHKGVPKGPQSEKHRRKISESKKGKKHTEETKKLLSLLNSGEKNRFYGKTHSSETREKISLGNKNNVAICPVCGKTMNMANYKKYKHGFDCKKGL